MRTEITVPFAFDTTPIEKMLQEHGREEAMRILERMVEENVIAQVPKKETYYGRTNDPDWQRLLTDRLKSWLDDHAEEIIDEAALLLAAKGGRRGRWRDFLKEVKEGSDD